MILYCTQEKCIVHDSRNKGDFWLKKVLINVHSIINGTVFGRTPTMVSLLVVLPQQGVCKAHTAQREFKNQSYSRSREKKDHQTHNPHHVWKALVSTVQHQSVRILNGRHHVFVIFCIMWNKCPFRRHFPFRTWICLLMALSMFFAKGLASRPPQTFCSRLRRRKI